MPKIVWMAALLTPSLRDSPALDGYREDTWKLLKARFAELQPEDLTQTQTYEIEEDIDNNDTGNTSLEALRKRFSKPTARAVESDPFREFKRYKAAPGCQVNTLDWWKANEALFPKMAILARKILSVVASSAPVERLFSTMGNIYNNKRSRLNVATARCQVLLHENKHL